MDGQNRRNFLADVGRGMLLGSVGAAMATDLGIAPAWGMEDEKRLSFGDLDPLVDLLQATPVDRILPEVVTRIRNGTDLRTIVAATALANARAFGGEDYTGFHTFMALHPAYAMSQELPSQEAALPILKVIYRNSQQLRAMNLHRHDTLHPVEAADSAGQDPVSVREATRACNREEAERRFAAIAEQSSEEALNAALHSVHDATNVHRVVLPWRAWDTLQLTGAAHAHTMLRQSVRFCLEAEENMVARNRPGSAIRTLLPRLLDQYGLMDPNSLGTRTMDDEWMEETSHAIYRGSPAEAAELAAAALADGIEPESIGEVLSMASCKLLLYDRGRREARPGKPVGSVHGDSVGVHATDAANAWRNIARVSSHRNRVASLIVGAYHTAGRSGNSHDTPYPFQEDIDRISQMGTAELLREAEAAVREQNQARASAAVYCYGQQNGAARPVFQLLLRYATSEDGALHAEKYYRSVTEEFGTTRAPFRWRQLVALARVTASESGTTAAGIPEARELLRLV